MGSVVTMVVGALIAGCGGDDDAARPSPPTAEQSAPAAGDDDGTRERGECPLTTEAVSAVVGVAVTDLGSCGWTSESVDVFYNEYPASLFSTYRQQSTDSSDVVTVDGVGDEAYAVVNGELHVLAGDLAFSVMVAPGIVDPDLDLDEAKRELAVLVLER
jgi:hypothetical protein